MGAPKRPYIPARYFGGQQSRIDRVVMHATVSPCVPGGARSVARYFQNPAVVSSAHYVVDPIESVQCVYDHTVAYHDGTNRNSIGYELCDPMTGPDGRWFDVPHSNMLALAARDVRDLCSAYGIPVRKLSAGEIRAGQKGICGHADMRDAFPGSTSHYDPGTAFPWGRFLSLVGDSRVIPAPGPNPSIRKVEPMILRDKLVKGENYGRIICPVGRASRLYSEGYVSITAENGATTRVAFQLDKDADVAPPGAGPIWDNELENASRDWHPVPDGTEYLEYWIKVEGRTGEIVVELK